MTTHAIQYVLEAGTHPRGSDVRRALMSPVRLHEGHRFHDLLVTLRSEPTQDSMPTTAPPRRRSLLGLLSKPLYPLFGISFGITSPCYSICSALLWSLFMKPWQARFLRARSAYADAAAVQLLRMADPVAEAITANQPHHGVARAPVMLGGGWPVDLSMFVGAEAVPSGDQWIRPRPRPGQRLWRLQRLGAQVRRGVEAPRPLMTRLILRTLAAPFVAAWYVIALSLVGFFMFVAIFIGLTVFWMVYAAIISLIIVIPLLVTVVPQLWELARDRG
jgi:hypothetical protein